MAGRHRKPTAWRRLLSSLSTSRHAAQVAALQAEVHRLRVTVTELRSELAAARSAAVEAREAASAQAADAATRAAAAASAIRTVSMSLPLVQAAVSHSADDPRFAGVPLDRGIDTAASEIVLPEAPLLDPRIDRAAELVDQLFTGESATTAATEARSTGGGSDSRAVA